MTRPSWWKSEIGPGNVISWVVTLCSAIYVFAVVQSDVKALQTFRDETKQEIILFRQQRAQDREAVIEMRGDIRVIRQLVEQQSKVPR